MAEDQQLMDSLFHDEESYKLLRPSDKAYKKDWDYSPEHMDAREAFQKYLDHQYHL